MLNLDRSPYILDNKAEQEITKKIKELEKRVELLRNAWDASVHLLVKAIEHFVHENIDAVGGEVYIKEFESPLDIEDYISLCERNTAQKSWVFITNLVIPGFPKQVRLAYLGYRTPAIFHKLGDEGGPSIVWSKINESGYPKWLSTEDQAPFAVEITTKQGAGDEWFARKIDGSIAKLTTTELAKRIASNLVEMAADN